MEDMKLAVVVVTYNRLSLLKECILHIEKQTAPFDNIIIVNNCSTDGTGEYLEDYRQDPRYTIIDLPENLGGAYGFYAGLEYAGKQENDWILLIDDDAMIDAAYMKHIVSDFCKNSDVLAYAGRVETDGKILIRHRTRFKYKNCYQLTSVPLEEYQKESFLCDSATFCGLVVNRKLIELIGLPMKEYFIWEDDAEYCVRIRKYSPIKNMNASVLNHKTQITFDDFGWKSYYGARNSIHLVKKHYKKTGQAYCLLRTGGRTVKYSLRFIKKHDLRKVREVIRLYKDAAVDGRYGRLGKNMKYLP